jgi:hypothetical protein
MAFQRLSVVAALAISSLPAFAQLGGRLPGIAPPVPVPESSKPSGTKAKPTDDATSLLNEVADLARSNPNWVAAGTRIVRNADAQSQPARKVRVTYRAGVNPQARLETEDDSGAVLKVCDGVWQWTYYQRSQRYARVLVPAVDPCAFPLNAMTALPSLLQSPAMIGTEDITLQGPLRTTPEPSPQRPGSSQAKAAVVPAAPSAPAQPAAFSCAIIKGKYGSNGPDSPVMTLWIDRGTKFILRYQMEWPARKQTEVVNFTTVDRGITLDAGLFKFKTPLEAVSAGTIAWVDRLAPATDSAVRVGEGITPPVITSILAAEPTPEAIAMRFHVTLRLTLEIGPDGIPKNVAPVLMPESSLEIGLTNVATRAVENWRFEPALKDGKPIAVVALARVEF